MLPDDDGYDMYCLFCTLIRYCWKQLS